MDFLIEFELYIWYLSGDVDVKVKYIGESVDIKDVDLGVIDR